MPLLLKSTVARDYSFARWPSASRGIFLPIWKFVAYSNDIRLSPEMIPDGTKDYSVYVLDPLEDIQSKARYGSAAANSRGVAVGMGLLSTVLNPHLPITLQVTGTIIGCDSEDAALEVVISLRHVSPNAIYKGN